ncbi:hypothetical protein C4K68_24920 [Pokkaliibacter plantistimulans]|uniref:Uncharacterized protein n=1 Tax=Proteobacteria bacterium 228 TaxID=2083153 RepID=A0A2S5KJM2_9PROT|nr:hypothetical protein [Pokkaliibacter plantistimulans]PPC74566.1 hypothetical protein C4K68_24920 [Pokkaliibacter plantistimulans]
MLEPISEALYFTRRNFTSINKVMLPYLALLMLADFVVAMVNPNSPLLLKLQTIFAFVIYPYFMAKLIRYLHFAIRTGRNGSMPDELNVPFPLWSTLFLGYLVHGLATAAGLLAFVLPGILIFLRMSFIDFNIVCRRKSLTSSITASWHQTSDNKIDIFVGLLAITIPVALVSIILLHTLTSAGWDLPALLLSNVISVYTTIFTTVFLFRHFTLAEEEMDNTNIQV